MITNFEKHTEELTADELFMVAPICTAFKKYTKDNPIKSDEIVKRYNANKGKTVLTGARLRKIVNYIRANSLMPIIATSSGYYVSHDKEEILKQIKSLNERANSIINCANGLQKFVS
jgi:hypothetical protein